MGRLFTDSRGRQQKGNELEFLLGPNFPKAPITLYQGWTACSFCISEGRVRKMLEEINPGNKAMEKGCMESGKPAHWAAAGKQRRKMRLACKGIAQQGCSPLKLLPQPCVYNQDSSRDPLLPVTLKIIQCLAEEVFNALLSRDQDINGVTTVTCPFATTTCLTRRDSCLRACHCH